MHVMGSITQFSDMGLFQEGLCPPSAPSVIRATQPPSPPVTLAPPPPPVLAPPPPPPPPPLLPPPLLPGLGDPTEGLRRNKSVRKFFWKTIPEHQVKGRTNLWTQGPAEQHQIDVQTIEELFGHNDCQSNSKAPPTRAGRGRTSFRETKEEVCILDGKRGMNIGIFLKQFKRPNQAIVEDIRGGNSEPYGAEPLRELLKLLPESDEVKKLKAFIGDVAKLSLADSFVYLLIQLPSYVFRIESMLLKEEFPAECEAMKQDIKTLRSATKELMCCEELHAVLHLVLQAGNILNAGGYAGNAVGFKLSSLPSLADTKANKPGMNLLHFVALEAQKRNEKLLEFPLRLSHVKAASRISLETLDSELQKLVCRTRSIEESVQRDTELLQQLDTFLQRATSALCSLRGARQQLKRESEELLDFFCEDKDTFRLDDCFNIFNSFCLKFTAAVKDNAERERKEAARQRRLQELEEQKRHSWAGGEQIGAFGFRSSSELDMNSALSRNDEAGLLMELLMPKSHPRSPLLRRSGSFRRTRLSSEVEVRTSEPKDAEKKDGSISLQVPNEQKTPQNTLNTDTDYLRNNSRQAKTSTPTSDLNNNGKEGCKDKTSKKDELNHDFSSKIIDKSRNASNMSVTVEKCTLVPELKAFDQVSIPTKSKTQNDVVVTDFEEANVSKDTEKVESLVKTEEEISDTVIVWCVTGVCEVENGQTDQNDNQDVLTINSTNDMTSIQQTASQNTVPISSQPMPTTRLVDITVTAFETKMDSEVEGGDIATNQNEGMEEDVANQETGSQEKVLEMVINGQEEVLEDHYAQLSTNQKPESQSYAIEKNEKGQETGEEVLEKLQDSEASQNAYSSTTGNPESQCSVSDEQNGKEVSENPQDSKANQNAKSSTNAKTENLPKRVPSSKATGGNKSVRTLTTTESHNMRRVVPISRPNSAKLPDKPPGSQRGACALSVPNRSAPRQLERPSTAPSSRRSSLNKTENHEQDVSKKMAAKKTTQEKKKIQQEEKMCRSTLRSINQNEEKRGIVSAPATPIHKTTTPGFARNTASSSFRWTNTSLTKNSASSNVASSQSSANSSPKVSRKISSPKPMDRQSLTNSNVASSLNAANSPLSKISPPKILSAKLSPSSNLKNIQNSKLSNTESVTYSNAKLLSPNMSPRNSSNSNLASPSPRRNSPNNLSNSSPKNALLKTSSTNLAARSLMSGLTNGENLANRSSSDLTTSQSSTNSNLASPKISVNSVSNMAATHNLANSTSSNTKTKNSNLSSPKMPSSSINAAIQKTTPHISNMTPSENIANCLSPETSSQNLDTKSATCNFTDPVLEDSLNSNSNLASIHDSNLASPKMSSLNVSLNLTNNNNLDIACPQNSSSQMSSPSNLTSPTLQNSRNNNLDSVQDAATSALSNFTDTNCSEKSTKPQKKSSPSSLSNSQNSNLTSSGNSANCPPRILSPKATSRLTLTRNSTNSNSNLTQNLSAKSPKSTSPSLTRTGSLRVSPSSPKTPDLGLKRSPSARALPRLPLHPDAPSTGRRQSDSGNFSDKSAQLTKESRPTWR